MNIDFWFEFASTYSYPAAMRIAKLATDAGVSLSWRPFLLGPLFRDQGWQDSPFNVYPEKGRYMWRDLERICQAESLPFRRPSQFPRNGLLAARVAAAHSEEPWLPDFVRAIYRANFEQDLDISEVLVVERCLGSAGQSPLPILARAESAESKARLRAQTEAAAKLGIFGAPFFVVGRELFWGNDRLEQALAWSAEHAAQL